MVFGLGDNKEKDKQEIQKPQDRFDAKYLGGHKAYPAKKPKDVKINLFVVAINFFLTFPIRK
jgi:hypothetical protein